MKILFAPDWSQAVPYQRLLAAALAELGHSVSYLQNYKRVLPLTRLVADKTYDLLHLHWPEAYYQAGSNFSDWFRRARFPIDLRLATRKKPLVLTAHNLQEHNSQKKAFAFANYAAACRRAKVIFAHSAAAADLLSATYQVPREKITLIPIGDLSAALPPPIPQKEARAKLRLEPDGPLCLIFGAVEPYKGQEELLAWWQTARPSAKLAIVGKPNSEEYAKTIINAATALPGVILRFGWLADEELSVWLSAADCVVFNYRTVFTSGAAPLARAWGVPMILPKRLTTVDLNEPNPRVFRFSSFETDFLDCLNSALSIAPNYASAAPWRTQTSWASVAKITEQGYRTAQG